MVFEIRPSKMTTFGRLSVSKIVVDSLFGRRWSVKDSELIWYIKWAKSIGVKQAPAASKVPTFPAADFWYLEFYDLRNKIFLISSSFTPQCRTKYMVNFNYGVRGQNYVWTLRYFSWCVAFLNCRDVLSNDLFVQIARFILPIMISIYFHINNSTNMIMDEWDLTFMISLVQFHSKTSTGPGIMVSS